MKINNQKEINALIEQIDMLTKRIEGLDEQYQAPRQAYMEELDKKTSECTNLDRLLTEKTKDHVASLAEIERYKI